MKDNLITPNSNMVATSESSFLEEFSSVVQQIEDLSVLNPTKIALVDGNERISYHELNQQANQLAAYLYQQNISAGSIVGVCIGQSARRIVSFLAVLKTGAAYLPIDGDLPQARIEMMISDAALDLLIIENVYLDKIDKQTTKYVSLDLLHYNADFNSIPKENLEISIFPNSTAYVIYTSGSTGVPKGVMIGNHSFSHFVLHQAKALGINSSSRTLQFASPSFDAAVIDIWVPLVKGATIYLYPNNKIVGVPL